MASNMDTVVSYAISVRLIAFGGWIVFAAATAASGLFLVWTLLALMPVIVGLISLFSETCALMRSAASERPSLSSGFDWQ